MLNFGFTEEECDKFKKLVAALSINDFEKIDSIVDAFSPTDEERFQAYLDNLQPHEIDPSKISSMNSFITTMFTYYCKPTDELCVASNSRNKNRIKF